MASLRIVQHPSLNLGDQISLDSDPFIIGRDADCQLVVFSPMVSRKHAELRRLDGEWHVEDLRTRHGTSVNNQPISSPTRLSQGDEIRLPALIAVFEPD